MSKKASTITDGFGITEARGEEIFNKVNALYDTEECVVDVLKKLTMDFELNNSELVIASFFLGKMQSSAFSAVKELQIILEHIKKQSD
jgi:hypothetical protein